MASLQRERDKIGFKCPVVEPCFGYLKAKKVPWVQVVDLQYVSRLVSFAPRFTSNQSIVSSWYVYDILPVSAVYQSAKMVDIVSNHFKGQLEG